MTQERMELWSNDSLTEFAIKFNSTIIVNSSNNPDAIVKMTDECPYKEGYGGILYLNGLFTIWLTSMLF